MNTRLGAWAFTLLISDDERLESRVAIIVQHATPDRPSAHWLIGDMNATGVFGWELTRERERRGRLQLTMGELMRLLREDGQVIDLDATLAAGATRGPALRIIVRDGSSVDVLGVGEVMGKERLGSCKEADPALFLWPP